MTSPSVEIRTVGLYVGDIRQTMRMEDELVRRQKTIAERTPAMPPVESSVVGHLTQ